MNITFICTNCLVQVTEFYKSVYDREFIELNGACCQSCSKLMQGK